MEGLTPNSVYLKDLLYQVRKLTTGSLSLSNLFAEEACRLNWRDEASRLQALYLSIREQLDRAKSVEDVVACGYSKTKMIVSLAELAVGGTIRMLSKDKQLVALSDHLLHSPASKERPFGTVLICVGAKGMPDDVRVVSISQLARESNREESEVINGLRGRGCLLFTEKAFSLLIDKLTSDVQEGRLLLPISTEKLTEVKTSSCLKLEAKKSG